jgi:hypothetical protein
MPLMGGRRGGGHGVPTASYTWRLGSLVRIATIAAAGRCPWDARVRKRNHLIVWPWRLRRSPPAAALRPRHKPRQHLAGPCPLTPNAQTPTPLSQPQAQQAFKLLINGGLAPVGVQEQRAYVNFYANLIKQARGVRVCRRCAQRLHSSPIPWARQQAPKPGTQPLRL